MERTKKVSTANKATGVGVGAGVVTTWLAIEAQRRYGVPAEAGAAIVGGVFGFIARWAGKLLP
jgi:hypothetical protein